MGKLGSIAVTLVVIGVLIYVKLSRRSEADEAILEGMQALVAKLDVYPANAEYLDALVKRAHLKAFDAAYEFGSRRRGAKFDDQKYVDTLFSEMIADAKRKKKSDVAASLEKAKPLAAILFKEAKSDD